MSRSKLILLLIGAIMVVVFPTAALSTDLLPLKHGFYVTSDIPCKEASFGSLSSYPGGNVFVVGHYNCTLKLLKKSASQYNVSTSCASARDDAPLDTIDIYTINSPTSFTLKNKNGVFRSRFCERSGLPSPWGSK